MSDTDSEPAAASAELDPLSSSRYAIPIDFAHPGDSRAVVLGLLAPEPSRILELGCSTGLMTQVMAERGHRVTAVEIDPVAASLAAPFAHEMFVGDLDSVEADGQHLLSELEAEGFDTVVAADVLEHLRDPTAC
ncbi:class I SAM-dependent methyltransferase, partial [Ilumatobacter sp.]|uniref:class I SAM-dependent methyltransferase n=1 Tax=Ilumatobacter sp. TaxID=1967498 RepID=UPI0037520B05